jgi:TPR repeat protein
MQKANAGEPPAQHELGLRYLLGRGFLADTIKAAYWIQKAATQRLPLAEFNIGLLLINGRGVEWDPFKAYKYFHDASVEEIPEALYVMGLIYTEDFIVPRNWPMAYQYFRKASDLGSEVGTMAKKEMERRGLDTTITINTEVSDKGRQQSKTSPKVKSDTSYNLLFIDFHTDTTSTIADTTLIKEAYLGIDTLDEQTSKIGTINSKIDSTTQSIFLRAANSCNPEALCMLGRCYERGLNVQKDLMLAGVYYLRALHLESYRAPALLWKMMNTDEFTRELEAQSAKNNPDAFYVWSGITSIGFNKLLNEKQVFDLLQRATNMGHVPSIVELGTCYLTGRWIQRDKQKAIELWMHAEKLGSIEAKIRLAAATVFDQLDVEELEESISILRSSARDGSLFSNVALAYCYQKGIGVSKDKGEAYRLYHRSMLRGSETAYRALRSMHDEMRPSEKEFQISD